ncbi:MAG: hypothetical protein ACREPX_09410 [Rhodanobacteraceae bacterium]
MKLPFPYVRWERADPMNRAMESHGADERIVNGGAHDADSESVHLRRIERLAAALRDESARIARHSVNDLVTFESIAAQIASVLEDCRRECVAIIESRPVNSRSVNGSKRQS